MSKEHKRWGLWLAGLVAALAAPWFLGVVETKALAQLAVFSMFAVSLNLLLSFTGLLSFGHALFFGAGGAFAAGVSPAGQGQRVLAGPDQATD